MGLTNNHSNYKQYKSLPFLRRFRLTFRIVMFFVRVILLRAYTYQFDLTLLRALILSLSASPLEEPLPQLVH